MATTTYLLLKHPEVYEKLKNEVRTHYQNYDDINIASASQLPYFMAVLKESMRIFPPAPQGLPRKSPGWMVDGHYVPKGVSSLRCCFKLAHIVD